MKVVLFCGGLGTRLKEFSDTIAKPLVPIGYRPIIWHVMRYYAHYGHRDFILCLGFGGDGIKEYFLNYREWLSNDFVLSQGGREIRLFDNDISDWKITFVDTGLHSNIGERLVAVRDHLADEEVFLANYSDGLADVDLDRQIREFAQTDAVASMLLVRPSGVSFHFAVVGDDERVAEFRPLERTDLWVNGGFFALRREVFDYIRPGEELVEAPFRRLVAEKRLIGHRHPGFWRCMDTFKDKIVFDRMWAKGDRPWQVWKRSASGEGIE
jgi:glucose-1-phosphate cytidylyltransferase